MTPGEVIAFFRSDMQDETAPYLWTEDDTYVYLTEAHSLFVRGIGGIPALIDLPFVAGEKEVDLPSSLLTFRRVQHPSDGREIDIRNVEEDDLHTPNYRTCLSGGRPTALLVGAARGKGYWRGTPTTSGTAEAAVYRSTEVVVCEGNLCQPDLFEIERRYHRDLVYGMAMQALMKSDAETYDKRRATEQAGMFMAQIDKALGERDRANHRRRTVVYGGY